MKFLEGVIIESLAEFGIAGQLREGRIGVWVERPAKGLGVEDKVAALGVRIRRGISFHGIAINVDPDLTHFSGIVPCGISGHGVTSLRELGSTASMGDVDRVLRTVFAQRLGKIADAELSCVAAITR